MLNSNTYLTINRAYGIEAAAMDGRPAMLAFVSSNRERGDDEATFQDRLIWSAGVRNAIDQQSSKINLTVIDAYFTRQHPALNDRKEQRCQDLAKLIKFRGKLDRWFLVDMIRYWAGTEFNHHNIDWWANHLGRDRRAVMRLVNGTRSKQGIANLLDERLWYAMGVVRLGHYE